MVAALICLLSARLVESHGFLSSPAARQIMTKPITTDFQPIRKEDKLYDFGSWLKYAYHSPLGYWRSQGSSQETYTREYNITGLGPVSGTSTSGSQWYYALPKGWTGVARPEFIMKTTTGRDVYTDPYSYGGVINGFGQCSSGGEQPPKAASHLVNNFEKEQDWYGPSPYIYKYLKPPYRQNNVPPDYLNAFESWPWSRSFGHWNASEPHDPEDAYCLTAPRPWKKLVPYVRAGQKEPAYAEMRSPIMPGPAFRFPLKDKTWTGNHIIKKELDGKPYSYRYLFDDIWYIMTVAHVSGPGWSSGSSNFTEMNAVCRHQKSKDTCEGAKLDNSNYYCRWACGDTPDNTPANAGHLVFESDHEKLFTSQSNSRTGKSQMPLPNNTASCCRGPLDTWVRWFITKPGWDDNIIDEGKPSDFPSSDNVYEIYGSGEEATPPRCAVYEDPEKDKDIPFPFPDGRGIIPVNYSGCNYFSKKIRYGLGVTVNLGQLGLPICYKPTLTSKESIPYVGHHILYMAWGAPRNNELFISTVDIEYTESHPDCPVENAPAPGCTWCSSAAVAAAAATIQQTKHST